ncbi:type VI secretion protein [Streptomyces sp. NPDC059740]|uniref:type VI secretion protein n=1 Tax=Streptomyces sp. NPDC059740 TaxID=3346926 RepID=UPI00364CACED
MVQGERGYGAGSGRGPAPQRERGVPDALLVGGLVLLLGLTVLVWLATGLSALLSHGAWPTGLGFTHTPGAMRHLVTDPHDLAAAWPDAPARALPGYGLFWGVFLSELMVLFVVTVFLLGTATRYRAVRARRRAALRSPQAPAATAGTSHGRLPSEAGSPRPDTEPAPGPTAASRPSPALSKSPQDVEHGPAPLPAETAADGPPQTAHTPDPRHRPETASPVPARPHTGLALDGPPLAPGRPTDPTAPAPLTPLPPGRLASALPSLPALHYGLGRREAVDLALATAAAADGPLVVASTDPAVWRESKDARAKLGPVLVHDPLHLLDTPARLRWSPTEGCEALATATARAAALLAPVRPPARRDSADADAAEVILRCWLHAAALEGRPFRQLHRWANTVGAAQEPVRVLRTHPGAAAGQAGELESVLTAYAERRDTALRLVRHCLAPLSSVHIRDAVSPLRADTLALGSFLAEGGTLYLVGEPVEDPRTTPSAMPLFTALLSYVVEHGRRMAERSSDGRLDPPLTLVLHDIAALAPLPALPELLDAGPTRGLLTLATLRSPEQRLARWPQAPQPW